MRDKQHCAAGWEVGRPLRRALAVRADGEAADPSMPLLFVGQAARSSSPDGERDF
ncbi:MAG: hypothetical protein M3N04_03555 [Actinomycetota bacterium]|nr:hypothetical protein [Actinomycetota bacterium]